MGKRNCFAPVTFARSGGAASVRPFPPFDGDNQGGIWCFPLEKARIRAALRESRSVSQLHRMRRYFTFLRPLSGFSSHFCNTHFRDTWFSSLPLFSNYSTGFRICDTILFLNIFKKSGKCVIMETVMRNETFSNNRSGI